MSQEGSPASTQPAVAGPAAPSAEPPPATPTANPGWYPDPRAAADLRYWDGTAWTEETASRTPPAAERLAVVEEPRVAEQAAVAEQPPVPEQPAVVEELPVAQQAAVVEELPVAEQAAVVEELPVAGQAAVAEQPPVAERLAVVEEPRVAERRAVVEEPRMAEPGAVVEAAPLLPDSPPAGAAAPEPAREPGVAGWLAARGYVRPSDGRVISGVCVGLAQGANAPVWWMRLMMLATFGLAYIPLALVMPEGERVDWRGPLLDAIPRGVPAPTPARTDRPFLKEFVDYLWSSPTTPWPVLRFKGIGFRLDGLQLPPNAQSHALGHWYPTRMPFGTIALYPGWLVFLTESHNKPGRIPALNQMLPTILDQIRESLRYMTVGSLLREGYRILKTPSGRERLRRLLGNPNSFFVPLASVTEVKHVRGGLNQPRIVITTADGRELCLAPHGGLEIGPAFGRVIEGFWTEWQPQALEVLRAAADRNGEEAPDGTAGRA